MLVVVIVITGPECQKPVSLCGSLVCVFRWQRVPGSVYIILNIVHHLDLLQTQGCTNIIKGGEGQSNTTVVCHVFKLEVVLVDDGFW